MSKIHNFKVFINFIKSEILEIYNFWQCKTLRSLQIFLIHKSSRFTNLSNSLIEGLRAITG